MLNKRYNLLQQLSKNEINKTHLAYDEITNQKVVIKQLNLKAMDKWKSLELFERETKILKNINHKYIPAYIDNFTIDKTDDIEYYLVQEYIDAPDLDDLCENGLIITEKEAISITEKLLEILEYLHNKSPSIIHRDINPKNILLKDKKDIYLVDFGSVQDKINSIYAGEQTVSGTFGYMPPEQILGRAFKQTDLYALGMTLIYLLSKREPSEMPLLGMKPDYRDFVNISVSFANFIDKLIETDYRKRFSDAKEALSYLENYVKKGKIDKTPIINQDADMQNPPEKQIEEQKAERQKSKANKPLSAIFIAILTITASIMIHQKVTNTSSDKEDSPAPIHSEDDSIENDEKSKIIYEIILDDPKNTSEENLQDSQNDTQENADTQTEKQRNEIEIKPNITLKNEYHKQEHILVKFSGLTDNGNYYISIAKENQSYNPYELWAAIRGVDKGTALFDGLNEAGNYKVGLINARTDKTVFVHNFVVKDEIYPNLNEYENPTISCLKKKYKLNENIVVHYFGIPPKNSYYSWLTLVKSGLPIDKYNIDKLKYTKGRLAGTYVFNGFDTAGEYEARLYTKSDFIADSFSFSVE